MTTDCSSTGSSDISMTSLVSSLSHTDTSTTHKTNTSSGQVLPQRPPSSSLSSFTTSSSMSVSSNASSQNCDNGTKNESVVLSGDFEILKMKKGDFLDQELSKSSSGATKPVASSSKSPYESEAVEGACGGSSRPNTVEEFLKMKGTKEMFAVTPLTWCPHLTELQPLPSQPLNCGDPCSSCSDSSENWVCLVCYNVACSRFVNEHMLYHRLETEHNLTLSYSDLSVWCYACDHYVDNEVLYPMKNAAHISKFGEALPGFH